MIWVALTSRIGRWVALAGTALAVGLTFLTRYGNQRAKAANDKLKQEIRNADEKRAKGILDRVNAANQRVRDNYDGPFRED